MTRIKAPELHEWKAADAVAGYLRRCRETDQPRLLGSDECDALALVYDWMRKSLHMETVNRHTDGQQAAQELQRLVEPVHAMRGKSPHAWSPTEKGFDSLDSSRPAAFP